MIQDPEIRFFGDLQRLRPEPGDVFVLSVAELLSMEHNERIRQAWHAAMGEAKLVVLPEGYKLSCVAMPTAPTDSPAMISLPGPRPGPANYG